MISHLGRYQIISELGQGAMGIVYKANDPLIDRIVAIKTINLGLALDEKEEYEGRFYQEAKAAGRLNYPNIVTIYDVGKSGDVAYIAMEFLQGRELRDIMNEAGLLPIEQVLEVVAQVALGLAYAHEHGIVHRDIKPSNIMVVRDGHVKITDFGIARMASSAVRTQTGMVLGSPKYMSPEQVLGKTIDQRSDIFSLGVMLYEMLTGQAPFNGENINAIMYQTINGVPMPPSLLNRGVPEMVNFIVAKALAKKVDDRYQNAKDLADDLRACRSSLARGAKRAEAGAVAEKRLPEAIDFGGRRKQEDEEQKQSSGLSPAFDSAAATMRLAALTASSAEVDELSKTLKMARPTTDALRRASPPPAKIFHPPRPGPQRRPAQAPEPGDQESDSNLLLVAIVVLMLLGIVAIFMV